MLINHSFVLEALLVFILLVFGSILLASSWAAQLKCLPEILCDISLAKAAVVFGIWKSQMKRLCLLSYEEEYCKLHV